MGGETVGSSLSAVAGVADQKRREMTRLAESGANKSAGSGYSLSAERSSKAARSHGLEQIMDSVSDITNVHPGLKMMLEDGTGDDHIIRKNWKILAIFMMYSPGRMADDIVEAMHIVVRVLSNMPPEIASSENPIDLMKDPNSGYYDYFCLFNLAAILFDEIRIGIHNNTSLVQEVMHKSGSTVKHVGASVVAGIGAIAGSSILAGVGGGYLVAKLAKKLIRHTDFWKDHELGQFYTKFCKPSVNNPDPKLDLARMNSLVEKRLNDKTEVDNTTIGARYAEHYLQMEKLAKKEAEKKMNKEQEQREKVSKMIGKSKETRPLEEPLLTRTPLLTGAE